MSSCRHRDLGQAQAGGITIIVALMLLVLLTIAALAMSRNSLREIVTSGFTRQGAMARNAADSGLEWATYWIDLDNSKQATGIPLNFTQVKKALLANSALAGVAKDITSSNVLAPSKYESGGTLPDELKLQNTTDLVQGFTLGLTRMGKLPISMTSQGSGSGAFAPATGALNLQAPDLWAIRSDAQVIQGGITFVHAKEIWISTPVQ